MSSSDASDPVLGERVAGGREQRVEVAARVGALWAADGEFEVFSEWT